MFEKSDKKSEELVGELINRFNLQGLSNEEVQTLISMAKDRTLAT